MMSADTALWQAAETSKIYFQQAVKALRDEGLNPKDFPEVIAAMINASAQDYHTAAVTGAISD